MISEEYSRQTQAPKIFLDVVESIAGVSWYGYGPKSDDEDSLLYLSFHVRPEKADEFNKWLLLALSADKDNFWFLQRTRNNRFYLTSNNVKSKSDELGSYEKAIKHINESGKNIGRLTAKKLISLSDYLRDSYKA